MGESPVKGFFRPSGAPCRTRLFPWLAPWATFSRPSGADAHESYQQNVETPEPAFSRPCPLSSGHIQAGRRLGTNAEVAAWKGGSTEPLTWRTLSLWSKY